MLETSIMDTPSDEQQRAADSSAPTDPADTAEHDLVGNEQSEVTLSLFLHQERYVPHSS